MDIRPIRTDEDHHAALAAIEACWGAPEGTEEGDKLDVLLALVDIHEAKRWPIEIDETFDPIDVLRYAIDDLGHTQAELAELLERDDFSSNRHPDLASCLSMIFSENRCTLFGIML